MFGLSKKDVKNPRKAIINNSWRRLADIFSFDWSGGWYFNANNAQAMRVGVFVSCIKLISNAVATTPIKIINQRNEHHKNLKFIFNQKPNANKTAFDLWQRVIFDLFLHGNAFLKITKDNSGEVIAVDNTASNEDGDIIHFRIFGGRPAIDILTDALLCDAKLKKTLENDRLPPVVKTGERLLADGQVDTIVDDILSKIEEPIVLPQGFDLLMNANKSLFYERFKELKDLTNEEIARFFNIPFGLLSMGGASQPNVLDTQNRQFLQYALNPIFVNIEQTLDNALLSRFELMDGVGFKFNRNALIFQTDANNRANFYKQMLEIGVYDIKQIKQMEDIDGAS